MSHLKELKSLYVMFVFPKVCTCKTLYLNCCSTSTRSRLMAAYQNSLLSYPASIVPGVYQCLKSAHVSMYVLLILTDNCSFMKLQID